MHIAFGRVRHKTSPTRGGENVCLFFSFTIDEDSQKKPYSLLTQTKSLYYKRVAWVSPIKPTS